MTAAIIDGRAISAQIKGELAKQVATLKARGVTPRLAVILAGDDAPSLTYVTQKQKTSEEIGMRTDIHRLPATGDAAETSRRVAALIDQINADPAVDGLIVQIPLPDGADPDPLLERIHPFKDADGLHPANQGLLLQGRPRFLPATPHGVQQLLVRSGHDPSHKHVVIVGRSILVGRPLAAMLMQKRAGANATVTVCHTGTPDIGRFTRQADIVVAAAGSAGIITGDMVREGVVVIDVGTNRVDDPTKKSGYRLVGDVDFDSVAPRAAAMTPVPGGVGPMTVTMLLTNVVRAATLYRNR